MENGKVVDISLKRIPQVVLPVGSISIEFVKMLSIKDAQCSVTRVGRLIKGTQQ